MNSETVRDSKSVKWPLVLVVVIAVAGIVYVAAPFLYTSNHPAAQPQPEHVDMEALTQKANAGDDHAAIKLARLYVAGAKGRADVEKAAALYRKAADKGNAEAMAGLGELYQSSRLITNGLPTAIELYRKAADLGNVTGQYDLAFLYEQGLGLTHDSTQAAKYYLLAAQGGDPTAQFDIGQRYALGLGVNKDLIEAFKWLSLASQGGLKNADDKLEKVKSEMDSGQVTEAKRRVAAFQPRVSS
jgi:TPR repeat protein